MGVGFIVVVFISGLVFGSPSLAAFGRLGCPRDPVVDRGFCFVFPVRRPSQNIRSTAVEQNKPSDGRAPLFLRTSGMIFWPFREY